MTPQEKAKELVEKFTNTTHPVSRIMVDGKECALIAVDEIINIDFDINSDAEERCVNSVLKYYEQVKQEIEKL